MNETGLISEKALETYLADVLATPVSVVALRPLGAYGVAADPKGFGYGVPFEVE